MKIERDMILMIIVHGILQASRIRIILQAFCLYSLLHINGLISSSALNRIQNDETKIYALYFPQFHNDSLNNRLWGQGFTDWDSLRSTSQKNRYGKSILRPHPETGYYNLMDIEIRRRQAKLARHYGVDGFIYHHYWFYHPNDTYPPPLSQPLLQMLQDGEPNLPFAFNWATDSWLGSWYGRGKTGELLHSQYFPEETNNSSFKELIKDHYNYLKQFFYHFNYIKIHRVPIMFVYPRVNIPLAKILTQLAQYAREDGFARPGIHFVGAIHDMSLHQLYTEEELGFPNSKPNIIKSELFYPFATLPWKQSKIPNKCLSFYQSDQANNTSIQNKLFENYHRIHYVSTLTGFDNTPRRAFETAQIWNRSFAPYWNEFQSFEIDLKNLLFYERCCQSSSLRGKSGKFIVINAWNEWAEGMSLEPSLQYSDQLLTIISQVKDFMKQKKCTEYDSIASSGSSPPLSKSTI